MTDPIVDPPVITEEPWLEPITLAETKLHIKVSDTTEDSLITSYITAAREYCENYQNRIYVGEGAVDMGGLERAACLLLVGHWYENRQAVVYGGNMTEVPFSAKALLDLKRNVPA